ncbi:polar amino acid transport system permease protein [Streptomyces olivoverticillatus]|uniref:Histidine/lysine/arginine/ornithine transport system permease protein HisM n=1 Tax=Streptomyces olivoverticillatus TaxID=66427 RepID=A0A7W7LJS7_9ACTN|nr:polar amino acid transport system permease protein [Streptomyces olivoverticillatus]
MTDSADKPDKPDADGTPPEPKAEAAKPEPKAEKADTKKPEAKKAEAAKPEKADTEKADAEEAEAAKPDAEKPEGDKAEKAEPEAEKAEPEPEADPEGDPKPQPKDDPADDPKGDDPKDDPEPEPAKGKAKTATATAVEPEAVKAIPVRHYGRWVAAVVVLALLGLLVNAFASANVHYHAIPDYLFNSNVISGLGKTVLISVLSMALGLVLGIVLAVMRLSKNPVTSSVSWLYIWFFRGTPVYVQLLLWFNLALIFPYINLGPIYRDEMSDFMTPFMAALLGLGLNEAAYMSEIVRAGIQSVDEGQTEASHALGMSQAKTLRRIVLPQAMRVIVPPTGNEFINMLKTSSLAASAAQYLELLRSTSDIGQTTGATVEMLFLAATWYLILTSIFSVGQFYLERHYARGSLRSLPLTPWQKIRANLSAFGNRSKGGVTA